eukprot:6278390-Amphidinium_carterae.1
MQHSDSLGSMASTISVHSTPMEEAFGDWSGSTGEAPAHHPTNHPDQDQSVEGSWQQIPLNTGFTMATDVGTQQYLNPVLQPSPFETVQSVYGWTQPEWELTLTSHPPSHPTLQL